eukprot:COSAG05_NODE_2478_length_3011_cov_2.418613_4_plen_103_part_00
MQNWRLPAVYLPFACAHSVLLGVMEANRGVLRDWCHVDGRYAWRRGRTRGTAPSTVLNALTEAAEGSALAMTTALPAVCVVCLCVCLCMCVSVSVSVSVSMC